MAALLAAGGLAGAWVVGYGLELRIVGGLLGVAAAVFFVGFAASLDGSQRLGFVVRLFVAWAAVLIPMGALLAVVD
jgi:hypothetical protein